MASIVWTYSAALTHTQAVKLAEACTAVGQVAQVVECPRIKAVRKANRRAIAARATAMAAK